MDLRSLLSPASATPSPPPTAPVDPAVSTAAPAGVLGHDARSNLAASAVPETDNPMDEVVQPEVTPVEEMPREEDQQAFTETNFPGEAGVSTVPAAEVSYPEDVTMSSMPGPSTPPRIIRDVDLIPVPSQIESEGTPSTSADGASKNSSPVIGTGRAPKGKRTKPQAEGKVARKRVVPGKSIPVIQMFPDIDVPRGIVRMNRLRTHTPSQFHMSEDGKVVWNDKGYRTSKCTHPVMEPGAWYYEARMMDRGPAGDGNARVGWGQISANLQGPLGMDPYGYSVRWTTGTRFHRSIGDDYAGAFEEGDIMGVLILVPPMTEAEREDLEGRKWAYGTRYLPFPYICPTPVARTDGEDWSKAEIEVEEPMPRMAGSQIVYFLNGAPLGVAYTNIFFGLYYAAVSCYNGARVAVDCGPDFQGRMPVEWEGVPVRAVADLGQYGVEAEVEVEAEAEAETETVGHAVEAVEEVETVP